MRRENGEGDISNSLKKALFEGDFDSPHRSDRRQK